MPKQGLLTLLTDFGNGQPFVGMLKGVILSLAPHLRVVDLCHEIAPQNVRQAAFIIADAYPYFPSGTVHLAVVDPGVGSPRKLICLRTPLHLFVGPDNGIFSLILNKEPRAKAYQLVNKKYWLRRVSATFHGRDILAPVAARLALGLDPQKLGPPLARPYLLPLPLPRRRDNTLVGEVIYADRFGNLSTNVTENFLSDPVKAVFCNKRPIGRLSSHYAEVAAGRPLALINSSGRLEIAVSRGNAAQALMVNPGDPVKIIFQ